MWKKLVNKFKDKVKREKAGTKQFKEDHLLYDHDKGFGAGDAYRRMSVQVKSMHSRGDNPFVINKQDTLPPDNFAQRLIQLEIQCERPDATKQHLINLWIFIQ